MVTIIKKGTSKTKLKELFEKAISKPSKKRGLKRFAGVLKSEIDPLEYQKKMRDEWK